MENKKINRINKIKKLTFCLSIFISIFYLINLILLQFYDNIFITDLESVYGKIFAFLTGIILGAGIINFINWGINGIKKHNINKFFLEYDINENKEFNQYQKDLLKTHSDLLDKLTNLEVLINSKEFKKLTYNERQLEINHYKIIFDYFLIINKKMISLNMLIKINK